MPLPPAQRRPLHQGGRAFTLIELLVSMTVLTLLVLTVSQLVGGAASVANGNRQSLDADGQARLVFDRLSLDFERMLKRQDVDYLFASLPGNDKLFFYSEAPAYFGNVGQSAQSPLALVGYRIDASVPARPTLSRLGKGLSWEGNSTAGAGAIVFLSPSSLPGANVTPKPETTLAGHWPATIGTPGANYDDGADATYHVLADQVCRLEICFLLKPRLAPAQAARYSVNPFYDPPGTAGSQHAAVNGLQDVRAVVVALAVLDRTSRQIAPDLSRMSTALRDITSNDLTASPPALMAKVWQDEIDQNQLATDARIPQAAAARVRVYQRHFYLDTN